MANTNRFIITDSSSWSVTADEASIGNIDYSNITWEPLSALQAEIDGISAAGTLDLTGRYFAAVPNESNIVTPNNTNADGMTINGGTISGAMVQSWSAPVNGVVTADLTTDTTIIGSAILVDPSASLMPRLAAWPEPPPEMLAYPTDSNENWIVVTESGITNGTIQTVSGDNAAATITGFTITDPTTLAYINSGINGLDPTSLCVFHHSSTNRVGAAQVVSWDPVTGVAVLNSNETLPYNGEYFSFAFTGNAAFLRYDGDYVIDQHLNKAFYRPKDSSGQEAMVSLGLSFVWRSDYDVDLTFNGVEFFGGSGSLWSRAYGAASPGSVVFNDCYFHEAGLGSSGMADYYDCRFIRLLDRGIDGPDGITVERCYFKDIQHSSAISTKCTTLGDSTDDPVRLTTIRDCYFTGPASDHGQAISLYKNTWQNATVERNLFANMPRYIAFQGDNNNVRTTPGVCTFQNNLMVFDSQLTGPTLGQPTFAFNGNPDDSPGDSAQEVIIRSNSILMSPSVYGLPTAYEDFGRFQITIAKLVKSTVYVENNLLGAIDAAPDPDPPNPALLPHNRANNQQILPAYNNNPTESVYGITFGSTDLPTRGAYANYITDWENLTLATPLTTAATDGGPVGIRWAGSPTVSEILDPPLDWHQQWTAEPVPVAAPGDLSTCWRFEDNRPSSLYEPMYVLDAELQAVPDGGSIDLTGRQFLSDGTESVTLSSAKSINITGGTFASGVEKSFTPSAYGPGVYECDWDFQSNGATITSPAWLWSPTEKPAKLVSNPPVSRDVEFGTPAEPLDARDDYGFGSVDRYSILDSAGAPVGDNSAAYTSNYISSITIGGTDAAAVKAAFDWDLNAGDISDTRGCFLNVQASDNRSYFLAIVSVIETAGDIVFTCEPGSTVVEYNAGSKYVNAAVIGPTAGASLQAGQAVFMPVSNKIYWKPRTGTLDVLIGFGSAPIFKIGSDSYTYPDTLANSPNSKVYSFTGVNFPTGYSFIESVGARVGPLVDVQDSTFTYNNTAITRVSGRVTNCIFDQSFYAQLYTTNNTEISKNYFGTTYQSSNINVSSTPDESYGIVAPATQGAFYPVTVDRNFFVNPATQHGQGMSLYQGACGNSIVTNNIFMNMTRAFSASFTTPQGGGGSGIRTDLDPTQLKVVNNIFYESAYGSPQAPYSINTLNMGNVWNHTTDAFYLSTDTPPNFVHELGFNTHISTRDVASRINMYSGSQDFRFKTRVHNNYLQGMTNPIDDALYFTTGATDKPIVQQESNMFERRCLNFATSISVENSMLGNLESTPRNQTDANSFLDASTFRVGGVLTTSATDGGELGARYISGHPSLNDLRTLNNNPAINWWSSFVPETTLPSESTVFASDVPGRYINPGVQEGTNITP
jgi:hypothetical protein